MIKFFSVFVVIILFNTKLNAEETIIIPTSTPIKFQKAETVGPDYGAVVDLVYIIYALD